MTPIKTLGLGAAGIGALGAAISIWPINGPGLTFGIILVLAGGLLAWRGWP